MRRLSGIALCMGLAVVVIVLTALGVWQLQRRVWKHDLIARVAQRIHAPAQSAPEPGAWPTINRTTDEYKVVRVTGHFLPASDALVQAVTDLGGGYWVLTPFKTDTGFTVLINRGFVPVDWRTTLPQGFAPPRGPVTVTGLLRLSEPGGAFLHRNKPEENRWYSRDVLGIAQARGLTGVAPYFIDARARAVDAWPRGGLTVIDFPDNHLVYAITWFGLALLVGGLSVRAWRTGRQTRYGSEV